MQLLINLFVILSLFFLTVKVTTQGSNNGKKGKKGKIGGNDNGNKGCQGNGREGRMGKEAHMNRRGETIQC